MSEFRCEMFFMDFDLTLMFFAWELGVPLRGLL